MNTHRMRSYNKWIGLIAMLVVLPVSATQPVERMVWGQVTQVTPKFKTVPQLLPTNCPSPKPSKPDSLATLLAWDLDLRCKPNAEQRLSGYEVHYIWDGRTYKTTLPVHPGSRVRLKLTIR